MRITKTKLIIILMVVIGMMMTTVCTIDPIEEEDWITVKGLTFNLIKNDCKNFNVIY